MNYMLNVQREKAVAVVDTVDHDGLLAGLFSSPFFELKNGSLWCRKISKVPQTQVAADTLNWLSRTPTHLRILQDRSVDELWRGWTSGEVVPQTELDGSLVKAGLRWGLGTNGDRFQVVQAGQTVRLPFLPSVRIAEIAIAPDLPDALSVRVPALEVVSTQQSIQTHVIKKARILRVTKTLDPLIVFPHDLPQNEIARGDYERLFTAMYDTMHHLDEGFRPDQFFGPVIPGEVEEAEVGMDRRTYREMRTHREGRWDITQEKELEEVHITIEQLQHYWQMRGPIDLLTLMAAKNAGTAMTMAEAGFYGGSYTLGEVVQETVARADTQFRHDLTEVCKATSAIAMGIQSIIKRAQLPIDERMALGLILAIMSSTPAALTRYAELNFFEPSARFLTNQPIGMFVAQPDK